MVYNMCSVTAEIDLYPRLACECFDRVWNSIPKSDRGIILEHWKRAEGLGIGRARIEVDEDLEQRGVTRGNGTLVSFSPRALSLDSRYISALIAHELSHVHDWAVGHSMGADGRFEVSKDDRPDLKLPLEEYAINKAKEWGYELPGDKSRLDHLVAYARCVLKVIDGMPDSAGRRKTLESVQSQIDRFGLRAYL